MMKVDYLDLAICGSFLIASNSHVIAGLAILGYAAGCALVSALSKAGTE